MAAGRQAAGQQDAGKRQAWAQLKLSVSCSDLHARRLRIRGRLVDDGSQEESCQLVSRGLVAPNYDTSAAEETQKRGDGEQAGGASAVEKVERDPDVTPCRDPSSQGETLQNAAELDTKAIRGPGQPTETSFTAPVAEASECSEGDEGD